MWAFSNKREVCMTLNVQDATNEANQDKLPSWLTSLVEVAEIDKEQNYKQWLKYQSAVTSGQKVDNDILSIHPKHHTTRVHSKQRLHSWAQRKGDGEPPNPKPTTGIRCHFMNPDEHNQLNLKSIQLATLIT